MPEYQPPPPAKLTVAKTRRILGMIARNYTDEEIEEIVRLLTESAEISYRYFLGLNETDNPPQT